MQSQSHTPSFDSVRSWRRETSDTLWRRAKRLISAVEWMIDRPCVKFSVHSELLSVCLSVILACSVCTPPPKFECFMLVLAWTKMISFYGKIWSYKSSNCYGDCTRCDADLRAYFLYGSPDSFSCLLFPRAVLRNSANLLLSNELRDRDWTYIYLYFIYVSVQEGYLVHQISHWQLSAFNVFRSHKQSLFFWTNTNTK